MRTVAVVVKMTKDGIDALDKAVGLYNRELDQIVPWKKYEETLDELERHLADYSNESGHLVGEIKTHIKHAHDSYRSASKNIYELCGLVKVLLANYLQLFEKPAPETYEELRATLIQVLDHGITKINAAQVMLERSSMNFKNVAGKLKTLHRQFDIDFDSKSNYFQGKINQMRIIRGPFGLTIPFHIPADAEDKLIPELQRKLADVMIFFDGLQTTIEKTNVDIDTTKSVLGDEVQNIENITMQIEETKTLVPLDALRDNILESVNSLIAQCHEYQKCHGENNC